ncbi:hypothetical protein [Tuwongella immobilis]|uniref:Leucine-rich repeat-containing protein typical subtype n=1 Tax=Tuwongella immobilis TaxID=692036 RepID=A0A6C2YUX3_9BACT|nr:hypothetical protein [Tuwongella immobilis]VIP04963.1 Leucine-rich repeat-containing protein typical subtype OS=Herpetosiphon aurantiacus (strain ATCC 23779 / DSM 785) GN=Haur_4051 PE=4 SV=1 [Tuwongella immobilis]VTS07284.1 Leucine-rich repeat-containing protein typical subtype OS=Herpetosiphon aurantiacus (strain ATCC 23779 / DSM 785) GN=Haur_4051 PE=4 SV=1 [Tuwongella immobilis]
MNPPESLLQACYRDPDPAAALVVADWFEEHGQLLQSQLMRAAVTAELLGEGHPDAADHWEQAERCRRQLLLQGEWQLPDSAVGSVAHHSVDVLHRGLPMLAIARNQPDFLKQIPQWLTQTPARSLLLAEIGRRDFAKISSASWAPDLIGLTFRPMPRSSDSLEIGWNRPENKLALQRLELRLAGWYPEVADELSTAASLTQLQSLTLAGPLGNFREFEAIPQSPMGRSLRELTLQGNPNMDLQDASMSAVRFERWLHRGGLSQLRSLRLLDLPFAHDILTPLRDTETLPQLERLMLLAGRGPLDWAPIGELLRRGQLRMLEMPMSRLAVPGILAEMLSRAGDTPGLRLLNLHRCRLPEGEIETLANWPGLASVTQLSIGGNELAESDLAALARSPYAQSIQTLDLSGILLGGEELRGLAGGWESGNLRELMVDVLLGDQRLASREALFDFLESPSARAVRRLSLRHVILGDDGVSWLGRHSELRNLQELTLTQCAFTPAGIRTLFEAPRLSKLWRIQLRSVTGKWPPTPTYLPRDWITGASNEFLHTVRMRG